MSLLLYEAHNDPNNNCSRHYQTKNHNCYDRNDSSSVESTSRQLGLLWYSS